MKIDVTYKKNTSSFILVFFVATILFKSNGLIAEPFNVDEQGNAIKGYDPVSYFSGEPQPGKSELSYEYEGATFLFSSPANLELFKSKPEAYSPQYYGYCAYGVRMGKKLDIDPMAYHIHKDKLYLMLNPATKKIWMEEKDRNIHIADRFWPELSIDNHP
jgi:YHS domain-containing protein